MNRQMNHPNYSAMAATGSTISTGSSIESSGGIGLTDKDLLEIMLIEHKQMVSAMTNCILESANPQLRHDCLNLLNRDFEHQKMIFDAMHQRGWYPLQTASPQDLQRAQQQLTQQQQELEQHQHLHQSHSSQQPSQQFGQGFNQPSMGQQHFGQNFNQPSMGQHFGQGFNQPHTGTQHFGHPPQQSFMQQQQNHPQPNLTQTNFAQKP